MSEPIRNDDNMDLEARIREFEDIKLLYEMFGIPALRAIELYYRYMGYEAGTDTLLSMVKSSRFHFNQLQNNPVETIESALVEFFSHRGGNMPEIWAEDNTIFMRTKLTEWCPTPIALEQTGVPCRDICRIHKRSFMKGFVNVFEEFYPAITINCYNVGSRLDSEPQDCVEAFQVITH